MSTLIEAISEAINSLDFSEKENLDFLNRICDFYEVPEFHINDLELEADDIAGYKFYQKLDDGYINFTNFPLETLGEDGAWSAAAWAIDSIYYGDCLVPSRVMRAYELF